MKFRFRLVPSQEMSKRHNCFVFTPATASGRCQSQRDCASQPWVARNELPWEAVVGELQPQGGCVQECARDAGAIGRNPVGVEDAWRNMTQGSSCLATLGFTLESLRDSPAGIFEMPILGIRRAIPRTPGSRLSKPELSGLTRPTTRLNKTQIQHSL